MIMKHSFVSYYFICYVFFIFIGHVILNRACYKKECEFGEWLEWGSCNATCGGGVQVRRKSICCNVNRGTTLDQCLTQCKLEKSKFVKLTTDYKSCAQICTNMGRFNTTTNRCDCFSGSYGLCCDGRYPRYTRVHTTHKHKANKNGNLVLQSPQNNDKTMGLCINQPCVHGTCVPLINGYFCFCESGYEGQKCQIDKDDCQTAPCMYGECVDKIGGYFCKCNVFFKGKRCSKMKFWAMIAISLGASVVLAICCCCVVCCPPCRRRRKTNDKTRLVAETLKTPHRRK